MNQNNLIRYVSNIISILFFIISLILGIILSFYHYKNENLWTVFAIFICLFIVSFIISLILYCFKDN